MFNGLNRSNRSDSNFSPALLVIAYIFRLNPKSKISLPILVVFVKNQLRYLIIFHKSLYPKRFHQFRSTFPYCCESVIRAFCHLLILSLTAWQEQNHTQHHFQQFNRQVLTIPSLADILSICSRYKPCCSSGRKDWAIISIHLG